MALWEFLHKGWKLAKATLMFITDETLRLLNQNNPTLRKLNDEVLLRREKQSVHLVVSVDIEESMVKEAPVKIKGCSGLQD